jgi:hypothetical protein
MKTSSDPREWHRQEEQARERARLKMQDRKGGSLAPMYVAAALVGAGALYLLLVVAGAPLPGSR